MWWQRKRSQIDFASEVQSHIDLESDRLRADGLTEEEARWQARKSFGNTLRSREAFYESQRLLWLDHLKRDFAYAIRQIRKDRIFTTVATLTLALGIGSASAIFTLVHATLLGPLAYRDGER